MSEDRRPETTAGRALVGLLDVLGAVACRLPLTVVLALGRALGELIALTQRKHIARIAEHHTALFGYPPSSPRRFHRAVYRHYGQLAMEILLLPSLTRDNVRRIVDMTEIDDLFERLGRDPLPALIATTGHWGNWEWTAAAASLAGLDMLGVVRPLDNPSFDRWLNDRRELSGMTVIDKWRVVLRLKRQLSDGQSVAIIADQHASGRSALWVRYGARPAATVPTIAMLHLTSGAPIAIGAVIRAPGRAGQRYVYRVVDLIEAVPGESRRDDAVVRRVLEQINDALARGIADAPPQYLWTHRRWRTPPPEVAARYPVAGARSSP